jgi:hypothetical protein
MSFEEHGFDELRDYQTKYAYAWVKSGCPSDQEVAEVFVEALPPVTADYDPTLQLLFDLFRQVIDKNIIPLNRIMENTIQGRLTQVIAASDNSFEEMIWNWTASRNDDDL